MKGGSVSLACQTPPPAAIAGSGQTWQATTRLAAAALMLMSTRLTRPPVRGGYRGTMPRASVVHSAKKPAQSCATCKHWAAKNKSAATGLCMQNVVLTGLMLTGRERTCDHWQTR